MVDALLLSGRDRKSRNISVRFSVLPIYHLIIAQSQTRGDAFLFSSVGHIGFPSLFLNIFCKWNRDLQECTPSRSGSLPLYWLRMLKLRPVLPGNPIHEHVPCASKPRQSVRLIQNSKAFASGEISLLAKSNILTMVAKSSQVSSFEKAVLLPRAAKS